MSIRRNIDWEAVEREYLAGIRSLKDIGAEYGVSDAGIIKRARRDGWTRDLSAKIKAKADALVSAREVSAEVSLQNKIAERQVVEANANLLADAVLNQRADVKRARSTVQKLWDMVDIELDHPEEFSRLGELLADPENNNQGKLNDIFQAAIKLPQQIKNVKLLADAIKVMIELERRVLKIDEQPVDPMNGSSKMTDAQRVSRIASILAKASAE